MTELTDWLEWFNARPPNVQDVARMFPPTQDYHIISTGRECFPYSYDEADDGTVTMTVTVPANGRTGRFAAHRVFGLRPDQIGIGKGT